MRSAWTIIGYAKKSDRRHIKKVEFSWKGWILLWFCGIVCLKIKNEKELTTYEKINVYLNPLHNADRLCEL